MLKQYKIIQVYKFHFIEVVANKSSGPCGLCLKNTATPNQWPTTFYASRIPAVHVDPATKQTTTTASGG